MSTLNFDTSMQNIEDVNEKTKKVSITLDGRKMAIRQPTTGRAMIAMRAVRKKDLGGFLDFMLSLFKNEEDREYIVDRLEDDDDPFEVFVAEDYEGVTLYSIFAAIMEEMAARPTQSPSGSRTSPSTTGKPSTGGQRRKATRRATSPSTGS